MLTIHARNIKKSAFIRSQLEASKIKKKNLLKKNIFYLYLLKAVKSIPFEPVLDGWVQKMPAEEEERGKEEKRKGGNNGDQNRLFLLFFFLLFFYSPRACFFFICAVVIFRIYKEN